MGTWRCPSGNGCDVFVVPGQEPIRELAVEWDTLPLVDSDKLHYLAVILPAIERRAREYFELVGGALVVLG